MERIFAAPCLSVDSISGTSAGAMNAVVFAGYTNATNVRTGLPRLLRNPDLTVDAMLASACLPLMHQAIEIDGDAYWDGGFSGNPLITPLIRESTARDILLAQINPVEHPGTPRMAHDILNRLNEISFNANLKKELRGIAMFQRLFAAAGGRRTSNSYGAERRSRC